jgi:iron(III) transport system ATP-binding protein
MATIELKNITYRYALGGVSDASFQIPEGKIACLIGPSGSGKTTLLRLIAGFLKPQQGSIIIGGKTIAEAKGTFVPPQKRRIGLVFQQHALFPHLSVAENILFGCPKKDKAERAALLQKLLADFKIAQHEKRYPHQISGGEQQRVALARAIASEPALLLMDEPFSSLDKQLRAQVQQQFLEVIRARNITTLMVTHDEDDARVMADMVIPLSAPALVAA